MNAHKFTCGSEEKTRQLAAHIASDCRAGDCLLLCGDLGVGKTAFARGFILALCDVEDAIISPSFSLLQPYKTRNGTLLSHVDLYRVRHKYEILEIGLQEALQQGICLIEWPQIIEDEWPHDALLIEGVYGTSDMQRIWTIQSKAARWQDFLNIYKNSYE